MKNLVIENTAPEHDTTTHVSEAKKAKVKELAELMKKKTVMVISVKGLPSAQFQDIKKKLRSKAKIQVVKKSLVKFALDHCGIKELHGLVIKQMVSGKLRNVAYLTGKDWTMTDDGQFLAPKETLDNLEFPPEETE